MKLTIVSDVHIDGPEDPLYLSLLQILSQSDSGDHLVLAGDIFDLFVGNKTIFKERYRQFLDAMKTAGSRGVALHYIEGNHDFLLRRVFSGMKNVFVHSSEVTLELSGKRFYVAHGDLVNRKDYGYRLLRFFYRSPVMRLLVLLSPGKWLDAYGKGHSQYSRGQNVRLPEQLPGEKLESLRLIYRNFAAEQVQEGWDFVVLGHCHDRDEMKFRMGSRVGQYINMGFPRAHRSILQWKAGDSEIQRTPFGLQAVPSVGREHRQSLD